MIPIVDKISLSPSTDDWAASECQVIRNRGVTMDSVEHEMLRHLWFPVARVADLHNGVAGGSILGEELVVYGDGDRVTVAQGFCPHRGAALRLGQLREGALEYPYHGWLFETGSGRCTRTPSLPPGRSRPHAALRTYPAEVAYGLVWSCLDDPFLPSPTAARVRRRQLAARRGPAVHRELRDAAADRELPGQGPLPLRARRLDGTRGQGGGALSHPARRLAARLVLLAGLRRGVRRPRRGAQPSAGLPHHPAGVRVDLCLLAVRRTPAGRAGGDPGLGGRAAGTAVWLAGTDAVSASQGADLADVLGFEQQVFEEDHPIVENQ
ncbi:Rieske 2Fe-2S domain-containing protein [Streptomyces luomodiensis]|uniref:Rieske 2Fe-2S domain-containing protein n=1 Tax=Streptomyces luomodiensis TaxID=3026192 RepID=UPI003D77ECAA